MKIQCSCKNPYQDKIYGVGNRMANPTNKDEGRCTSCGVVKVKAPVKLKHKAKAKAKK